MRSLSRFVALLAPAALVASALAAPASAAPVTSTGVAAARTVGLITGDAVVITHRGARTEIAYRSARRSGVAGSHSLIRTPTATYAIPGAARRYLGSILDPALFDLSAPGAGASRLPVTLTLTSASTRPSVPGLVITSRSGASARGYLDASRAGALGDALAAQWRADTAARRVPTSILGGLRRLSPAAVTTPVQPQFPQVTLILKAVDRSGRPAQFASLAVINVDDGRKYFGFPFLINGQARISVPKGHYSLLGEFDAFDGTNFSADLVPVPDFDVTTDRQSYVVDERRATVTPSITTPRPATAQSLTLEWDRGTGGFSLGASFGFPGDAVVRVAPTDPSPYGTTDWVTQWELTATPASGAPYRYDISFHDSNVVPADQSRSVAAFRFATVRTRFYSDGTHGVGYFGRAPLYPFQFIAFASLDPLQTPTAQTTYIYNDPGAAWFAAYNAPSADGNEFGGTFVADGLRIYPPGSSGTSDWLNGALTPGVSEQQSGDSVYSCYMCRDDTHLSLLLFPATDSDPGHQGITEAVPRLRIWRDGTSLFDKRGYIGADVKVPTTSATYRLLEDVNNVNAGAQLSTHVATDVSFRSAAGEGAPLPEGGYCDFTDTCLVLPVLTARVPLPTDLDGTVAPGPATIEFTAGHVQGAQDPALTSVVFQYAIDGGAYRSAAVTPLGGHHYRVTVTAPRGSRVSTRVVVNDAVGGHLVQTATDAYRVATS